MQVHLLVQLHHVALLLRCTPLIVGVLRMRFDQAFDTLPHVFVLSLPDVGSDVIRRTLLLVLTHLAENCWLAQELLSLLFESCLVFLFQWHKVLDKAPVS